MKLSNSQLKKLKSAVKTTTAATLNLPSNITGTNETNFLHNFQLADR